MPTNILDLDNLQIVMKKTRDVIPYWRNPRRNDKTVEELIPVIQKRGFNVPIVIDKNNVVVKGHARLKAAKRLGMEEVPCVVTHASEESIKADRIADNKIQELSSWDFEKRDLELQRIGELSFGKLFFAEETPVAQTPVDVPTFEYKPTALDFSEVDVNGDDTPTRHEHPPVDVLVDIPDGYAPQQYVPSDDPTPGEGAYVAPGEAPVPEKKRFRTLCPYCGKVVTIDV